MADSLVARLAIGLSAPLPGAVREKLLTPRVGEVRAYQVGTAAAGLVIAGIAVATMRWLRPNVSETLAIGVLGAQGPAE